MLHHRQSRQRHGHKLLYIVIAILIAAYALFYVFTSGSSAMQINSQQTVSMQKSGALYFTLPGNHAIYVAFLSNTSQASAVLYITKSPILESPIEVLSMKTSSSANVSTSLSQYADMEIMLLGSNSTGASFLFTPIPKYLNIKASNIAGIISVNGSMEQLLSYTTTITTTISPSGTSTPNTTSSPKTSNVASTTVPASTTVSQYPVSTIFSILNLTPIGKLMDSYTTLYKQTKSCAPATYNSTYDTYVHVLPTGASTFYNVSSENPTGFNTSIAQVGTNYNVSYIPIVPSSAASMFKAAYVVAEVNISSFSVSEYSFKGLWQGLNYTNVDNAYSFYASVGNACGIYIPYIPGG